MTRDELMKKAAECDLGRVVGPLDTLLDEEWESLHRFADHCLRAEVEALKRELQAAASEWETRPDGKHVRKDRWEFAVRRIVSILWGPRYAFELEEVVDAVRALKLSAAIDAAKGGGNG